MKGTLFKILLLSSFIFCAVNSSHTQCSGAAYYPQDGCQYYIQITYLEGTNEIIDCWIMYRVCGFDEETLDYGGGGASGTLPKVVIADASELNRSVCSKRHSFFVEAHNALGIVYTPDGVQLPDEIRNGSCNVIVEGETYMTSALHVYDAKTKRVTSQTCRIPSHWVTNVLDKLTDLGSNASRSGKRVTAQYQFKVEYIMSVSFGGGFNFNFETTATIEYSGSASIIKSFDLPDGYGCYPS
ncbi:MAG: hypothetical protein AAFO07_01690 [Bacteroidota bacterium]